MAGGANPSGFDGMGIVKKFYLSVKRGGITAR